MELRLYNLVLSKKYHHTIVQFLGCEGANITHTEEETSPIQVAATSDILWEMVSKKADKLSYLNRVEKPLCDLPYQRAVLFAPFEPLKTAEKRLLYNPPLTCEDTRKQVISWWLDKDRKRVDEGKSPIYKDYFDIKRREDSRLSQSLCRTPLEPEEESHLVALDPRFLKLEAGSKRKDREIEELTLKNRELTLENRELKRRW